MTKSDINLLPKKKTLPLSVSLGIAGGIALFVILLTIGIALPSFALKMQQSKLVLLEQELSSYSDVEATYVQRQKDYTTLQGQQKNYNDFIINDKQTLDLSNKIFSIKPATITLTSQSYDNEKIVLTGYGTTDIEIARFEVALRKLGIFPEIILSSISGAANEREFNFTLMHKVKVDDTKTKEVANK